MSHHDRALAEIQKLRQNFLDGRLVHNHFITDAGQLLNLEGNRKLRIYEYTELVSDFALFHPHSPNFDDPVVFCGESCRLDIEYHIGIIQALSGCVGDNILQVVHQIALHAVDHLEIIALFQAVAGVRIGLYHAMVRHCDGCMAPGLGTLNDALYIRDAVHIAHFRVTMKLHALQLAIICTGRPEI